MRLIVSAACSREITVNALCEWLQLKLRGPSTDKYTQAPAAHMFSYWCQFWAFVLSLVSRQKCLCFSKLCSSLTNTFLLAVCGSASVYFAACCAWLWLLWNNLQMANKEHNFQIDSLYSKTKNRWMSVKESPHNSTFCFQKVRFIHSGE